VTSHRELCSVCGASNGGVDIAVLPGYDHTATSGQFHDDPAYLAQAAARSIHVPEVYPDLIDGMEEPGKSKFYPLLDMHSQVFGDLNPSLTDLQSHNLLLSKH